MNGKVHRIVTVVTTYVDSSHSQDLTPTFQKYIQDFKMDGIHSITATSVEFNINCSCPCKTCRSKPD